MDHVRQIARAVLYEGYLLWPYRESALKNRHRWTIGGVHPEGYGSPSMMRTECLLQAGPRDTVDVCVRFLHVVTRNPPGQEAREREVNVPGLVLDELLSGPVITKLDIPDGLRRGPGDVARGWEALCGRIEASARRLRPDLFRITVEVANTTPWHGGTRDEAMRRTLVSAHTVLRARGARFVSLMDPPEELRAYAAGCDNVGAWPVLVGQDTVLSAPIILYDNPKISPESPGDLFDATEIDQLLTLSVLALSDEERHEIRDGDPRAREILDRCESLTPEELMRLHGIMRRTEP
ncbi:hypothetical protein [Nonomuraea sp. NPDC049695]|uniref:hypothetical protein n=1 Tax=Nonomuraea sp. NPDC049695 TaxID=3154734 RepID=UPI003447D439